MVFYLQRQTAFKRPFIWDIDRLLSQIQTWYNVYEGILNGTGFPVFPFFRINTRPSFQPISNVNEENEASGVGALIRSPSWNIRNDPAFCVRVFLLCFASCMIGKRPIEAVFLFFGWLHHPSRFFFDTLFCFPKTPRGVKGCMFNRSRTKPQSEKRQPEHVDKLKTNG